MFPTPRSWPIDHTCVFSRLTMPLTMGQTRFDATRIVSLLNSQPLGSKRVCPIVSGIVSLLNTQVAALVLLQAPGRSNNVPLLNSQPLGDGTII
jgi:hypothetical protein